MIYNRNIESSEDNLITVFNVQFLAICLISEFETKNVRIFNAFTTLLDYKKKHSIHIIKFLC